MVELSIDGRYSWTGAQYHVTPLGIVVLLSIACGLTNLRLGSLQPQDLALLGLLWLCVTKFIYSGFSAPISSKIHPLFRHYCVFLIFLALLALLAVRLTFYPLDEVSFLKQPFIFSLSKLLQLLAVVCGFLWLVNSFAQHKRLLDLALNVYWWMGIASCLYGIVCYAVLTRHPFTAPDVFGAYTFVVDGDIRARGFFNEGGPFGLYIVSVFVVGLLRRRVTGRPIGLTFIVVLSTAFVLSASKSGFLAAACLLVVWAFSAASLRARICYSIVAVVLLFAIGVWLDIEGHLSGYLDSFLNIEEKIASTDRDYSLLTGRVSALRIVPNMIAAHPLTGIGFGNYPLMRNDPNYLEGLPAVTEVEDLPGLGFPGIAAEIGVPATLWLIVLLAFPYWINRKKAFVLAGAALFQLAAHTVGLQLTFFYPWFVTACALGASFWGSQRAVVQDHHAT